MERFSNGAVNGPPHKQNITVITDFGCCSADRRYDRIWDTDREGDAALMAPEIATFGPRSFNTLNYERSNLWIAGSLVYQIFGGQNLFINSDNSLDSRTYILNMMPPLPSSTPTLLTKLIQGILQRNLMLRPDPSIAATICQLLLWTPSCWYYD